MKLFVVAFGLACVLVATPVLSARVGRSLPPPIRADLLGGRQRRAVSDQEAPVVRSESVVKPDGFAYGYETGNGIIAEADGTLKTVGDGEAISVRGQYKYTSPEGEAIGVSYVADENGYQPVGEHLPVPPPIPEAIVRSLEYIKNHPPPVENYKKP